MLDICGVGAYANTRKQELAVERLLPIGRMDVRVSLRELQCGFGSTLSRNQVILGIVLEEGFSAIGLVDFGVHFVAVGLGGVAEEPAKAAKRYHGVANTL